MDASFGWKAIDPAPDMANDSTGVHVPSLGVSVVAAGESRGPLRQSDPGLQSAGAQ